MTVTRWEPVQEGGSDLGPRDPAPEQIEASVEQVRARILKEIHTAIERDQHDKAGQLAHMYKMLDPRG
jgi:hypothetical protein